MALSRTPSVSVCVLPAGVSVCAAERAAMRLVASVSRQKATRIAVERGAVSAILRKAMKKTPRTDVSILGVCPLTSGNDQSDGTNLMDPLPFDSRKHRRHQPG